MTRSPPVLPLLLLSAFLAGCSTSASLDPRTWFKSEAEPPVSTRDVPGVEARLKAIAYPMSATVRIRESGDLMIVTFSAAGLTGGVPYRLVLHERGNCSSPNAFSAGAAWSPPKAPSGPATLIPVVYASTDGTALLTARIRGPRLGGDSSALLDRGVLLYEGDRIEPLKPDVPNNVIGCGAFVRATSLF
jgi:hypothetical protein